MYVGRVCKLNSPRDSILRWEQCQIFVSKQSNWFSFTRTYKTKQCMVAHKQDPGWQNQNRVDGTLLIAKHLTNLNFVVIHEINTNRSVLNQNGVSDVNKTIDIFFNKTIFYHIRYQLWQGSVALDNYLTPHMRQSLNQTNNDLVIPCWYASISQDELTTVGITQPPSKCITRTYLCLDCVGVFIML